MSRNLLQAAAAREEACDLPQPSPALGSFFRLFAPRLRLRLRWNPKPAAAASSAPNRQNSRDLRATVLEQSRDTRWRSVAPMTWRRTVAVRLQQLRQLRHAGGGRLRGGERVAVWQWWRGAGGAGEAGELVYKMFASSALGLHAAAL